MYLSHYVTKGLDFHNSVYRVMDGVTGTGKMRVHASITGRSICASDFIVEDPA